MTQNKKQQPPRTVMASHRVQYRDFRGALAEDYRLLKLSYPDLERFQQRVGECVGQYEPAIPAELVHGVEMGCGDGVTTNVLLACRDDMILTAVDVEPGMIERAHKNIESWEASREFELIQADGLEYVASLEENTVDIIASVWTLHNFLVGYRREFLQATFRCLKPGGLFVNGDKYAQDQEVHFRELYRQMSVFFDVYLPIGKYDFLKEFVLHNLSDEAPDRIMYELDSINEMQDLGFIDISVVYRKHMEAVLIAYKPNPG